MKAYEPQDITDQATKGSFYSLGASLITIILGFIRTTLLLRLLLPHEFGISTIALFYVTFFSRLFSLGLDDAFIHRSHISEKFRRTYLTLRMGLPIISMVVLLIVLPIITWFYPNEPLLGEVIVAYAVLQAIRGFELAQSTMLRKHLAFHQIALSAILGSVVMTIVAPLSAWLGFGVWSIVLEQYAGVLISIFLIFVFFRPWKPRFGWDKSNAYWFKEYGKNLWGSSNLTFLLDQFDDWFVGTFLGSQQLGYYSRAYEYAGYPRRVLANPIQSVFLPTYAHLQDEKAKLSRIFFKVTSFMVRVGGLFSLLFIFTAPEFIPLLLGEKWLPMLTTFQLMIIYTLFDPLSKNAINLLHATGHPQTVLHTRIGQAVVFIPAVIGFGFWFGIEGVALAANLMILVGVVWLFYQTKRVVQYSQRALWFWPITAVILTSAITLLLTPVWDSLPLWISFFFKLILITLIYGSFLWLVEKEQLLMGWELIWSKFKPLLRKKNQE